VGEHSLTRTNDAAETGTRIDVAATVQSPGYGSSPVFATRSSLASLAPTVRTRNVTC